MDDEMQARPAPGEPCPCGSGLSYQECCGKAEAEASALDGEADAE